MKLDDSRRSDNVEDDRAFGGRRGVGIGIGTIAVLIVGYFLGINPLTLLALLDDDSQGVSAPASAPSPASGTAEDQQVDFVRAVLGDTEGVWGAYFRGLGRDYPPPKLVLYTGSVSSACGFASAAAGPFYCPGDQKVYIDLKFYRQLAVEFGAPGAFAQAYVIAHEVGHHVQNLLGITAKAGAGTNRISIEIELQADCLAGVWAAAANSARRILEPGDLEQGIRAAAAVGDDTLQRRELGSVVPDSFTHGTSAQRVRWFRRGFDTAKVASCDTFGAGAAL